MSKHYLTWAGIQKLKALYRAGRGVSKKGDTTKIHSRSTKDNYIERWRYYAAWVSKTHPEARDLRSAGTHIQEWADSMTSTGKSAWTVRAYVSAACKVTGQAQSALSLPARNTADIRRSRSGDDKHYSADLEALCRAYGPRRSELSSLRGTDLVRDATSPSGYGVRIIRSKGGKSRIAPLCGPTAVSAIKIIHKAGNGKVINVPANADIHRLRAQFAADRYHELARPLSELSHDERYYSHNGATGIIYDRAALSEVSRDLGHGHYTSSGYVENPAEVVRHYSYLF